MEGRRSAERRRVREVRKYVYNRTLDNPRPVAEVEEASHNLSMIAATKITSPNTTLTALMQLIAWRLGMQRAMVSVVDESAQVTKMLKSFQFSQLIRWQYFLAEATRTLNLEDSTQAELGDDCLWMGCGGYVESRFMDQLPLTFTDSTVRSEALCAVSITRNFVFKTAYHSYRTPLRCRESSINTLVSVCATFPQTHDFAIYRMLLEAQSFDIMLVLHSSAT